MTKELILHLDPSQTGLTIVAKLFPIDVQLGPDIVMTESTELGIYSGDMPLVDVAVYAVRFVDSGNKLLAFGQIAWNGTQEINELDMEYLIQIISGDYVIAGNKLIINKSALSRNIDSNPIAEFDLLPNSNPPDASGGRTRST